MKKIIFLAALLPLFCLAAEHGEHGQEGIPVHAILIQLLNFSITIGLLIYLTRGAVRKLFAEKHKQFHVEVARANSYKVDADRKKREVSDRLAKLELEQGESLKQAQVEATTYKQNLIAEANVASKKMEEETKRTLNFELMKGEEELRIEILNLSIEVARDQMKDKVDVSDLKRLGGEFVEKIQVVRG